MIEIGVTKLVTVKVRNKSTRKLETKREADGTPVQRLRESNVWRVTRNTLGGNFGRDRGRRLVVGLIAPDQLVFCPQGTRQKVQCSLVDLYRIVIQKRANVALLEKARQRKATKQRQREAAVIARADRRLRLAARSQAG